MRSALATLVALGIVLTSHSAQAAADCDTYQGKASQILGDIKGSNEAAPGFVVAYACNGNLMAYLAEGDAIAGKQKLGLGTPFYLASLAKQFTAALALQLVEEEVMSLDDSPTKYLANLPESYRNVTLWQMLTHTSGIPDYFSMAAEKELEIKKNSDVYHLMIFSGELEFELGTDVAYSNSAYILVAEMIEEATGKGFAHLLNERIFKPLRMETAWVNEPGSYVFATPAMGYEGEDGDFKETSVLAETYGSGGIYMSMADYLKWERELTSGMVLSPFVREQMRTPATLPSGDLAPFSPGWISGEIGRGVLAGRQVQQAFGDLGGYRAGIRRFAKEGVTVIWFANNGIHLFDADLAERLLSSENPAS